MTSLAPLAGHRRNGRAPHPLQLGLEPGEQARRALDPALAPQRFKTCAVLVCLVRRHRGGLLQLLVGPTNS
jgi:hypothetical protein